MSFLKSWGILRRDAPVADSGDPEVVERRREVRRPVFQAAELTLGDGHRLRAVITDISVGGARVQYASRMDLPFRVRLSAPVLKLNCWARVAWQDDGAAGLEFQERL